MARSSPRPSLETATAIANGTLACARAPRLHPMCVAVLDDSGHLKVLKREDGAGILRPDIAIGKARGALGMGGSSRSIADRLKDRPSFHAALTALADGKVVPACGGLLLHAAAGVVGAVGVSGAPPTRTRRSPVRASRRRGWSVSTEDRWAHASAFPGMGPVVTVSHRGSLKGHGFPLSSPVRPVR